MTLNIGKRLGFSFVDYAKQHHNNIGSVRLKDGSSLKIIGCQEHDMIELYRVKHNRLYGGSVFKGEDAICKAAEEFCAITDKHAISVPEVDKAWQAVCEYYNPNLI